MMVLFIAAAPAIADFYSQPELVPVTIAFSPIFLAAGSAVVHSALLVRSMNFRKIALIQNASLILASIIAAVMAVSGLGVWSLVELSVGTVVIRAAMLWGFASWLPRYRPDRESFRQLWGFSSRTLGYNSVNYWGQSADSLLIGRYVSVDSLAYYNRAYSLMLIPVNLITQTAGGVMYPALSRVSTDRDRVKRVYLRAISMIAAVTFPVMVGLLVVAPAFIRTLYGPQWGAVVPLFRIFCLPALLVSISATTTWLFMSQGRADWMFRWGLVSSTTVILAFVVGVHWGARGVAISWAIWAVLQAVPSISIAGRLVNVSVRDVARSVAGVSAAAALMGIALWLVETSLPGGVGAPAQLAIGIAVGAVVYPLVLYPIARQPFEEVRQLLAERRHRRAAPVPAAGAHSAPAGFDAD
jgi:PST family polysaccharide transporter